MKTAAPLLGARRGRAALAASVALNLFLLGWIVGGLIRPSPPPPPIGVAERLRERLSPAGYARIAEDLDSLERTVTASNDRSEPTRRAVIAVASTMPFDAAALKTALAALAAERSGTDAEMTDRLAAILGRLDVDDRRQFAETLFRAPPGPPGPPPRR